MREALSFFGQFVTRFRETGALVPSSPRLARAMAAQVPPLGADEVIIELGPGTGVFTRELARRFPGRRIVAVEFNHLFALRLRQAMPEIQVVESCASRLGAILSELDIPVARVGAVISGLPLLTLPRALGTRIFAAIAEVLPPERRYVQFTYSKLAWRKICPPGFQAEPTHKVWLNFPPAEVLPFTRLATPAQAG